MAHILHLPVFPEGSRLDPDAINCLIMDEQSSDSVAHLILNTDDTDLALQWTMEFLDANPQIPQDEVTLTTADPVVYADLMQHHTRFYVMYFLTSTNVTAFYQKRRKVPQKVVELPIYC